MKLQIKGLVFCEKQITKHFSRNANHAKKNVFKGNTVNRQISCGTYYNPVVYVKLYSFIIFSVLIYENKHMCVCVFRPGKLISMSQLPLRPAAPAPHFRLQRRQSVSRLLWCCSLVPTDRGWPAGTRLSSPWRPCKKNI